MKLPQDREFYQLLPKFDIITCDSQILTITARLLGTPLKERVSGSDYFPRFCMRYRDDLSVTVFICGGAPGVDESAHRKINAKMGRQMVVGTNAPLRDYDRRPRRDRSTDCANQSIRSHCAAGGTRGRAAGEVSVPWRRRCRGRCGRRHSHYRTRDAGRTATSCLDRGSLCTCSEVIWCFLHGRFTLSTHE